MRWSLVAVKWEDVTSLARFSLAGDFDARRLFKLTVGLVVHETSDYMVLADDLDLSLDPHSSNNYGTLIPKGCIRQLWSITHFDDGREMTLPDPPLPVLAGNGRPRRNGKRGRSRPARNPNA